MAATAGVHAAADRLGGALAQEVDLECGIDRREVVLLADAPWVVDVAHGPELDRRVLVEEVVEATGAEGEGGDGLGAVAALAHPGHDAFVDQRHQPIGEQLGVNAEVGVIAELFEHGVRDGADPGLDRGAVRDAFGDEGADGVIDGIGFDRRHLDQWVIGLAPADYLGHVDLATAERAGHLMVGLEEQRSAADEGGHVVGVGAEREEAVAVRWRGRGDHEGLGQPAA